VTAWLNELKSRLAAVTRTAEAGHEDVFTLLRAIACAWLACAPVLATQAADAPAKLASKEKAVDRLNSTPPRSPARELPKVMSIVLGKGEPPAARSSDGQPYRRTASPLDATNSAARSLTTATWPRRRSVSTSPSRSKPAMSTIDLIVNFFKQGGAFLYPLPPSS